MGRSAGPARPRTDAAASSGRPRGPLQRARGNTHGATQDAGASACAWLDRVVTGRDPQGGPGAGRGLLAGLGVVGDAWPAVDLEGEEQVAGRVVADGHVRPVARELGRAVASLAA